MSMKLIWKHPFIKWMVSCKTIKYKKCLNSSNTNKMHEIFLSEVKKQLPVSVNCTLLVILWQQAGLWIWTGLSCWFLDSWKICMACESPGSPLTHFHVRNTVLYWITLIDFYKIPFSVGALGSFSILSPSVVASVIKIG